MAKIRITDRLSMIASVVEKTKEEKLYKDVRARINVQAIIDVLVDTATREAEKGERSATVSFTLFPNQLAEIVTQDNSGEIDDMVIDALSEEIDLNVRCEIDPNNVDQSVLTLYW